MSRVLGVFAFELTNAELHAVSSRTRIIRGATEGVIGGGEFKTDILDTGGEACIVPEERVTALPQELCKE